MPVSPAGSDHVWCDPTRWNISIWLSIPICEARFVSNRISIDSPSTLSMIRFSSGEQNGFSCTCTFGIKSLLIIQKTYMKYWLNELQLQYLHMDWNVMFVAMVSFCTNDDPSCIHPSLCNYPTGTNPFVLLLSWINPLCSFFFHQTALFHLAAWPPMCRAVVPTAKALPSFSPLPLLRLMKPSPGTFHSPSCLTVRPQAVYTVIKQSHQAKWTW